MHLKKANCKIIEICNINISILYWSPVLVPLVNAYENLKDKDKVKKKVNELLESFVTSSLDKNVEKSVLFRDAGNKYFKENKYQQALDCYNKSIFLAPCPRNLEQNNEEFLEFSMGLTNRCC